MGNIENIKQPSEEVLALVSEYKNKGLLSSIKLNSLRKFQNELIRYNSENNIDPHVTVTEMAFAYICSLLSKKIGTKLFEFGDYVYMLYVRFEDDLYWKIPPINAPRINLHFYFCVFEDIVEVQLSDDESSSVTNLYAVNKKLSTICHGCTFVGGIKVIDRNNNLIMTYPQNAVI